MNNVIDNDDNDNSPRLKIVKSSYLTNVPWSCSGTGCSSNSSLYTNDWINSSVSKMLNNEYYTGGVYSYYTTNSNLTVDFGSTGMKDNYKKYIANATWYVSPISTGLKTVSAIYSEERSDSSKTWNGRVGLIYASDAGYATNAGGNSTTLNSCLNSYNVNNNSQYTSNTWRTVSTCYNNDYFFKYGYGYWTMSSYNDSIRAYQVHSANYLWYTDAWRYLNIIPSLYLKTNVIITDGNGSVNNPYKISI